MSKGHSPFKSDGGFDYDHPSFPGHWEGRGKQKATANKDDQTTQQPGAPTNHCTGVDASGRRLSAPPPNAPRTPHIAVI